jgi:predicted dehydrogenase
MTTAIIGCGAIAASHIRILKKLKPDTTIILCDVDERRAREFAARWGVERVHTSIDDLLLREKPQTAHVLTPPRTHAVLAERLLAAGVHALVEKPVTETAAEYVRLAQLARDRGVLLCGGYSTLGMPVVTEALRMFRSGALGRLVAVHCTFAGSEGGGRIQYKDPLHWAYRLRGGILQNMIDHPLSLVLTLMDQVDDHHVTVERRNVLPFDCPDLLHLSLRNDHQVGSITLSLGHGCNERRAILIFEGGSIMLDMGRQLISATRGRGPQNFIKKALSGIAEGRAFAGGTVGNMVKAARGKLARDPGIANLMERFYQAVETGGPAPIEHETVLAMTGLLDSVWDDIDYQPANTLTEVRS